MTEEIGETGFASMRLPEEELQIYTVKIGNIENTRRITLPGEIAEELDLDSGDNIHYVLDEVSGEVFLTSKPPIELEEGFRKEK